MESEYAQVFSELIKSLDELMNIENSKLREYGDGDDTQLRSQFDKLAASDKLSYLRQVQENRRLIIKSSEITLPILRSVHQVEGLPTVERNLYHKVAQRDELNDEIIRVQARIAELRARIATVDGQLAEGLRNLKSLNLVEARDHDNQQLLQLKSHNLQLLEELQFKLSGVEWNEQVREIVEFIASVEI